MPRFQTVIRRARFVYSSYTAEEMQGFAQVLADTIIADMLGVSAGERHQFSPMVERNCVRR